MTIPNQFLEEIWPRNMTLGEILAALFDCPLEPETISMQLLMSTASPLSSSGGFTGPLKGGFTRLQEWNSFCEMRHPLYSRFIEAG